MDDFHDALLITGLNLLVSFGELQNLRAEALDQHIRRLCIGAGRTGRSLMRELRETAGERVVGFVDDNPRLRRRRLHGVPVVGTTAEMERILARTHPDTVLVTIPDAPRERLDLIVAACDAAAISCRFVRRDLDLDPRVVLGSASE